MKIGEGFVGSGSNAAHINVVLGLRDGPVGTAWATALATPREGHVPFVAVAQPNIPVVPFTLFVNKAAIANDVHGQLTWGGAQAGVAAGVGLAHQQSLFDGDIDRYGSNELRWADRCIACLATMRVVQCDGGCSQRIIV